MGEFDVAWIAILIASISAAGVIGGFLINWRRLGHDNRLLELHSLKEISDEMDKVNSEIPLLKTEKELYYFVMKYLNSVVKIAWVLDKNLISKESADYFSNYLETGLMLKNWIRKNYPLDANSWNTLSTYCKKNNIQAKVESEYAWLKIKDKDKNE